MASEVINEHWKFHCAPVTLEVVYSRCFLFFVSRASIESMAKSPRHFVWSPLEIGGEFVLSGFSLCKLASERYCVSKRNRCMRERQREKLYLNCSNLGNQG
jgi:hypothetical protein